MDSFIACTRNRKYRLGGEDVPDRPNGLYELRSCRIDFDFSSQSGNLRVYRAVERIPLLMSREIHQYVSAQNPTCIADKCVQHLELPGGKLHLNILGIEKLSFIAVEVPAVESQYAI
jgi:hypothetical protein